MDLSQLEILVAAVEAGGVQKAAERVFRTQPAVSMSLRKLEQELGAPLFDRTNRGAYVLTATGELLYSSAKRILRLRDEALAEVRDLRELKSGRVRIGANESTCSYLLPQIIEAFHRSYPKIKVEVIRQNSRKLVEDLKEGLVDAALISYSPGDGQFEAFPIMSDEMVLIVNPKHPLARKKSVGFRDLGAYTFIAHNVRSPSRDKVVEAFRQSETPLHISMEIASMETIKKLVRKNVGIAFVPNMYVHEELDRGDLVQIRIKGFTYTRTIWLTRRRTDAHSHAVQAFTKIATDMVR